MGDPADCALANYGDEWCDYQQLLFEAVEILDPYLVMFLTSPDCGPY